MPTLIFDTEAGGVEFLPGDTVMWEPGKKPPKMGKAKRMVMQAQKPVDIAYALEYLHKAGDKQPFRTIVLDSLSMLQRRLKKQIEAPRTKSGELNEMARWGKITDATEHMADMFQDAVLLPNVECVVVICGATTNETGKMWPLLQGKAKESVGHQARLLAYLQAARNKETNEIDRQLIVEPAPHCIAGNQLGGRLSGIIENPNLSEIMQLVRPKPAASSDETSEEETDNE